MDMEKTASYVDPFVWKQDTRIIREDKIRNTMATKPYLSKNEPHKNQFKRRNVWPRNIQELLPSLCW